MPAGYAHYRFGKLILPQLPQEQRQCIQRFRRMYDMGLQGPDFFFYYLPFMNSTIHALGKTYHRQSGQDFFSAAASAAASEASRAYLYGLLGHYCLDSICHTYIEEAVQAEGANHTALESEFDRLLLEIDEVPQPHTYDLSPRLKLTRGECMTVAEFYPPATGGNVSLAIRSMDWFLHYCSGGNRKTRSAFLARLNPELANLMIPMEPREEYSQMESTLLALFNQALKRYPLLLEQLTDRMHNGTPLGSEFAPTFNG